MSDLSKECKGCNMFCNGIYTCQLYKIEALKDRCPCLTCLIKVTCQYQCSERMILFALNAGKISDYEKSKAEKVTKRWFKNGYSK